MTNEQSIKIIRDLLIAVDNGGVLYSDKEKKKLKEALNVAIESLGAKYVITDDGKIYPLPKNPFPNAQSITIPPIKPKGRWEKTGYFCKVQCSVCHSRYWDTNMSYVKTYDYCPDCGADMREDTE